MWQLTVESRRAAPPQPGIEGEPLDPTPTPHPPFTPTFGQAALRVPEREAHVEAPLLGRARARVRVRVRVRIKIRGQG